MKTCTEIFVQPANKQPANKEPANKQPANKQPASQSTASKHEAGRLKVVKLGNVEVAFCEPCDLLEWTRNGKPIDPQEGVAQAFGDFDIVAAIDAVGAPARQVLVTAPTTPEGQRLIDQLPEGYWLEAMPSLWMSPGDQVLLLATVGVSDLEAS